MSLALRVGEHTVHLDGPDDLRALIAQAEGMLANLDEDDTVGNRPDGVPARKTGWRWTAPTGEVVTFSPTWAWIWPDKWSVGLAMSDALHCSRVGSSVRTDEDAAAWFAGWEAAGRPR